MMTTAAFPDLLAEEKSQSLSHKDDDDALLDDLLEDDEDCDVEDDEEPVKAPVSPKSSAPQRSTKKVVVPSLESSRKVKQPSSPTSTTVFTMSPISERTVETSSSHSSGEGDWGTRTEAKERYANRLKPRILENKTVAFLEKHRGRPITRPQPVVEDVARNDDNPDVSITPVDLTNVPEPDDAVDVDGVSSTSSSVQSSEADSEGTNDLLERAHDRIHFQSMTDKVKDLEDTIRQKDEDIERLTGQLRRAVTTKCDLVISHTELERHHEHSIKIKENDLKDMVRTNFDLLEVKADTEREFMNEILKLTRQLKDQEEKHRQELDDWERMHRNEMLEKDYQIAQLTESLRHAQGEYNKDTTKKIKKLSMF